MDDRFGDNGHALSLSGDEGQHRRELYKFATRYSSLPNQPRSLPSTEIVRGATRKPSPSFLAIGAALNEASVVAVRDSMISKLLQRGIDYTGFEIVSQRNAFGSKLALRTVNAPMPPSIYNPVMEAFEEVGGPPAEGFENMAAVVLAHERGGWVPIHPFEAEADQWLAQKCTAIVAHIHHVQAEIARWQSHSGDQTEYLCWPALAGGDFRRKCIVVSMVDHCFPHTQGGSNDFELLRGFIRSLPEYRRYDE